MPKKTTILIIILALVTGVLLFLAISEGQKQTSQVNQVVPTQKPVEKTSKVFFSPQNIDLSTNTATAGPTVDLMVDSGGSNIAGVQAELQYDPKAITNVKVSPASDATGFFGPSAVVLFNDVDQQTGRISFAIAISPNQKAAKGVGKLATISFSKAFGATTPTTTINFLDKTLVTQLGQTESVLKEAAPLNITLSSSQPVVTQPVFLPSTNTAPVTTSPTQ
ncbi:MAG TPA: cohesin domain-containing protein [Patescibacteria group bacterium]|nr:cohesin domain-containing protein [Patescibacteria group bacterium]